MTDDDPVVVFIARQPDLHGRLLAEHVDDGTGHCQMCTVGDWPCNIALYVMRVSHVRPSTQGAP